MRAKRVRANPKRRFTRRRRGTKSSKMRASSIRARRFAVAVKRVVGTEIKEKRYTNELTAINNTKPSGGAWPVDSNIYNMMPNATTMLISQGTGQGDRVGNKVKIVRNTLRFALTPTDNGATDQSVPCIVRTMFIYDRRNPTTAPTPAANGDFFQNGNGTSGFNGNLSDLTRPYNTDRYVVKRVRDYKVGWSASVGVTGADPEQAYYANNDFKMLCRGRVDMMPYCVKRCVFNDTSGTQQWRGLWFFVYAVVATPHTAAIANTNLASLSFNWDIRWDDA